MKAQQILIKYWGFISFRPLQEEIIQSVIDGKDTLALYPTGGGKSICFQIAALMKEGICIVISPLISLMKDQVEQLNKKGIEALYIHSGMNYKEIDLLLDRCVYDNNIKFLYVSPERLKTELFRVRFKKMNVSIIVVDEAHCISQWGYDFRPPYLKIADLREFKPNVPLLALTATATNKVVDDIQSKLLFKKKNIFRQSFERKNISLSVIKESNKLERLLSIVKKINGSGIIYVRNRKLTKEVADYLEKNKIAATYYHAGLDLPKRNNAQNIWMNNSKRVIVATNAFGLGINKPNVRFVIHIDIPDSIEAYYQEVGRAGRDNQKSWAIMLYSDSDIENLEKSIAVKFPEPDIIRKVYKALGNYFNLATDAGQDASFSFDILQFCDKYNFTPITVFNSIKILEKDGYIMYAERSFSKSKVKFNLNREELHYFQVENIKYENFIKMLLRLYPGILNNFINVSEFEMAQIAMTTTENVVTNLNHLNKLKILSYLPQTNVPQIIYLIDKADPDMLYISKENYYQRKKLAAQQIDEIRAYVRNVSKCRSWFILKYFGEDTNRSCGICSNCVSRNNLEISQLEFDNIIDVLKPILKSSSPTLDMIFETTQKYDRNNVKKIINWLIDNNKLTKNEDDTFSWV